MYRQRYCILSLAVLCLLTTVTAGQSGKKASQQSNIPPDRKIVYRVTEQGQLHLHVFVPEGWKPSDRRSAAVFFFGGGWVGGRPAQFYRQAKMLAGQGMVAACAEYRIRSRHKTTPFECVSDGHAAIRYVRQHAKELGIDPNRIAAAGGSAGGHVAACTALIERVSGDESAADPAAHTPNLLILFNPVIDTGPKGYGYDRLKDRYREISPVDHVRSGLPPVLIFHGTDDKTVPYENVDRFAKKMKEAGCECDLVPFEKMGHGFFNYGRNNNAPYEKTMTIMLEFLRRHGFLPAQ